MNTLSFQEDHISQVPALQLLQNLGYIYLRSQEVHLERKGRRCASARIKSISSCSGRS